MPSPTAPSGQRGRQNGQPLTMTVFKPWTESDVQKATEHIKHPKFGAPEIIENMEGLRNSYRLNGVEVERALRRVLGSDWASVKGNWDPCVATVPPQQRGEPLALDSKDLTDRLTAFYQRCNLRWV